MFDKLHLLSQDVPEGGDGFRWKAHPYLRIAGSVPKGPAVFDWSARQRADIEALWRDPTTDGARERLAKDLAAFCERLGWNPEPKLLEDAEKAGDEYILTISAAAAELYLLPWEVVQIGAEGQYLSDYATAQVRYAMPGLEAREIPPKPERPGVLFAWSGAGGEVPHDEQAAAIRAAAEAGGVAFRELAEVDEASLQAALDAGAPSVLHLLCHGLPGPDGEPSRLSWGAVDNPSEITATRLARLVRRHDSAIRMVVLSTCGGGDGYDNPMLLGSVAQELHKKGIRSVVASRYPLSVCGSCVMTRSLYDKLLRDAWSLERSLRYTREALLRVADHGETHPGDAYGIQLYAYDMERFVSDNEVEAERPVLATYPFGTAEQPVPAHAPPATELTLTMENEPKLTEDELVAKLRQVAEDEHLTVAIPLDAKPGDCKLHVHTTMDGAQRLLGAWRSKILHVVIGVAIGKLVLAKGLGQILQTLASTVVGKASAGTLAASIGAAGGSVGAAAGNIGAAAGSVGAAAGKGGAAVSGAAGKIGMGAARAGTPTSQVGSAAKVGSVAGKAGAAVGHTAASGGQAAVVGQVGVAAGHAGTSAAGAGLGAAGGAGGAGVGAVGGAGGAGLGAAGGAGVGAVGAGAGLGAAGGAGGAGLGAAGGAGAGVVGAGAGLGAAGGAGGAGLAVAGGAGGAALGTVGGAAGAGLGAAGAGLGAAGAGLGAAGAGKLAAVLALVGNVVSAKVVVALVGTAALAGGVAMYRAETRPPQATAAAAGEAAAAGPATSGPARRGTRARGTGSPASAATVVEPTASPDMVAGAPSAIGGGPSATAGGPTGTGEAAAATRNAPAGSVTGSAATAPAPPPPTTTGNPGGSTGAGAQDGAAGASARRSAGTADGAVARAPRPAGATGGAAGTPGDAVAAAPGPASATGGAANTDETAMPGGPAGAAGGSTGEAASVPAAAMGESAGGSTRAVPASGAAGATGGPTGSAAAVNGPGSATGGPTGTAAAASGPGSVTGGPTGSAAADGSGSAATGSAAGSSPRAGEPPAPAAEAKVERPTPPGRVAATGARVAPASGSTAAASPSEAAAPQPSDPSAASGAKPAAAVCGNGTKEAGEQCDDGNTRDGDGCSAKCRLEPMAIAPSALELERVSGNTDIHPSKQTRSAMIAAGVNSVTGVVRLCVDTAGAVTEVDLQDATGYAEYDRKLVAAVRDWRFHPFVIHGTAMAVCSTSEFVYAPK